MNDKVADSKEISETLNPNENVEKPAELESESESESRLGRGNECNSVELSGDELTVEEDVSLKRKRSLDNECDIEELPDYREDFTDYSSNVIDDYNDNSNNFIDDEDEGDDDLNE